MILVDECVLLECDFNVLVFGNLEGDVMVVEFFDYNCFYCKCVMFEIDVLLVEDGNICFVLREWLIFSEGLVIVVWVVLVVWK